MANRSIFVLNLIITFLLVILVFFILPALLASTFTLFFIAGLFSVLILYGLYASFIAIRGKDQINSKRTFFDKLLICTPIINAIFILAIYFFLSS